MGTSRHTDCGLGTCRPPGAASRGRIQCVAPVLESRSLPESSLGDLNLSRSTSGDPLAAVPRPGPPDRSPPCPEPHGKEAVDVPSGYKVQGFPEVGSSGSRSPILWTPHLASLAGLGRLLISSPRSRSVSGTQSGSQDVPRVIVVPLGGLPGLIPSRVPGPWVLLLGLTLSPDRTWALTAANLRPCSLQQASARSETQTAKSGLARHPHATQGASWTDPVAQPL